MAVELTAGSVVGIVMSSTVVSAVINGIVMWRLKLGDRKREDQAIAQKCARAQQEAVRALEAVAQDADEVLRPIEAAFEDYGDVGDAVFGHLKPVALRFEVPPQLVLDVLPPALVDQLYEFERALGVSADWLDKHEVAADAFDLWKLEVQRLVQSGLLACDLANRTRRDLNLCESTYVQAWEQHFEAALAKLAREYERDPAEFPLLPAIEARLTALSRSVAGR
ncbi:hypothetical protein [Burkholderia cenocepacia]|uniref:hypothetical protein n=1 Tax=Burkholderia cenocepacia TaxID=95486 RepID=UPI00196B7D32|nr:hypothetical protein [Burkholderia cenocepacia]MBN3506416.1 hypothetical protein [Burkholderia cenocepacia]